MRLQAEGERQLAVGEKDLPEGEQRSAEGAQPTAVESRKRLVLFAIFTWICTVAISSLYPLGRPVDELTELPALWAYSWVAAQAFLVIVVALFPALLMAQVSAVWAGRLGAIAIVAIPSIVLLDCLTFHWIGERFLSGTMLHICLNLMPGLLAYMKFGDLVALFGAILAVGGLTFVGVVFSRAASRRWSTHRRGDISPIAVVGLLTAVSGLIAIPALWEFDRTMLEMRDHSIRHPLCTFCIVPYRSVGILIPQGEEAIGARLRGLGLADGVDERIAKFNRASVLPRGGRNETQPSGDSPPDILIVIMESLQHSIISPEVMPNTHRFARQGLMLQNHFSGGNSSSLGIFSLVNGLESSFFPRASDFEPLMNRLLRQAGFEIGFFGGSKGWEHFVMDPFISPECYDRFIIEDVDWIDSDRRAIDRAGRFLSRDPTADVRPPRIAVVYLYSSHAPFASLPEEEVFQPASGRSYVTPFTEGQRELIYNRYRNSVRSLDRLLMPLMQKDRVMVVVGDHGESFLEDGTIGHGTRLSKTQNMTAGMMYLPGHPGGVIEQPTMHADVLPTILGYLDLDVDQERLFDGVDLFSVGETELGRRTIATSHYMSEEVLLIGPWTQSTKRPFGYRAGFSTGPMQLSILNPVDERGLAWDEDAKEQAALVSELDHWLMNRFGANPLVEDVSDMKLFERYLRHHSSRVRLEAIEIAELTLEPSEELIGLVGSLSADESPQVRARARQVVIDWERRIR